MSEPRSELTHTRWGWLARRRHRRAGHKIRAWQMYDTPGWTCTCGEEWIG